MPQQRRPPWKCNFPLLTILFSISSFAQEIPRDQYLKYIPLHYPSLVEQTAANDELNLYGDRADSRYRDNHPKNGIDDSRDRLFEALSVRFAPLIVRNAAAFPMDFRKMLEIQKTTALHVDRWNLSSASPFLDESSTIDLSTPNPKPCSEEPGGEDCKLLNLIRELYPNHPTDPFLSRTTRPPDHSLFSVLYFNFKGDSPDSWKATYQNPISGEIRDQYNSIQKTYLHPFLSKTSLPSDVEKTYDFVLQYWFFYPFNDAGNKHEGDWEHINVILSPLSKLERALKEEDIREMLTLSRDSKDPLVIKRIDYYMHNKVMTLDFAAINAYAPYPEWKKALEARKPDIVGDREMFGAIRRRAWADQHETEINTHPIIFLGEGKGLELVLSAPGGRNKDSHASYPFPGLYKDLGPADAAEEVNQTFDHQKYLGDRSLPLPQNVMSFAHADRIEILPDWERVIRQVLNDFDMRRKWAWMILPIRWGYPATSSPFAGIVSHAETGNISPIGPTFSGGWNRVGSGFGFSAYHPHRYSGLVPISPIDNLQNDFGWLNAPALILRTLPPLNLVFDLGFLPIRALFSGNRPIFYPADRVPFRFISAGVGYSTQFLDAMEWVLLFGNSQQLPQLRAGLQALDPTGWDSRTFFADDASSLIFNINSHLGNRFVIENSLRHSNSDIGIDVDLVTQPSPALVRGNLEMWEYTGSLRYNFATGGFQPYAKVGFGWVWYRLLDVTLNSVPIATPDIDYIREPSIAHFENLLPNAWHGGLGLEILPIKSIKPLPAGIDFSIRFEGTYTAHSLGISFADQAALGLDQSAPSVTRFGMNLYALISF